MGKTGVGAGPKNVTWYAEHAKLHKFGVGRGGVEKCMLSTRRLSNLHFKTQP